MIEISMEPTMNASDNQGQADKFWDPVQNFKIGLFH
jgi:hypothetical protein